ncbi:hypothetical protein J1614_000681 [Plenodomus biglobosus]|nr:hypothetical protein J1614_000681 [Plenodomus biglobosus]
MELLQIYGSCLKSAYLFLYGGSSQVIAKVPLHITQPYDSSYSNSSRSSNNNSSTASNNLKLRDDDQWDKWKLKVLDAKEKSPLSSRVDNQDVELKSSIGPVGPWDVSPGEPQHYFINLIPVHNISLVGWLSISIVRYALQAVFFFDAFERGKLPQNSRLSSIVGNVR